MANAFDFLFTNPFSHGEPGVMCGQGESDPDVLANMFQNLNVDVPTRKYIKDYYDMREWKIGDRFACRLGFIYDPSKFYIVTMHEEVTALQTYINMQYKKKHEQYSIPHCDVQSHIYCVVYTDNGYYRGYITKIPEVRSTTPRAIVFLIDFGYTVIVKFDCLFSMTDDLYTLPKFAIRACLSGVQPYKAAIWNQNVVQKFTEMTMGEVLTCLVRMNHAGQKVLYVKLYRADKVRHSINIGETLLLEKFASIVVTKIPHLKRFEPPNEKKIVGSENKAGVLVSKLTYPFLFPSHEAIENGAVPIDVISFNTLTKCSGGGNVLWPYFYHLRMRNQVITNYGRMLNLAKSPQ